MKWMNLKINKCPGCNKDFTKGLQVTPDNGSASNLLTTKLLLHSCGFTIREVRYRQIVSSQVIKDLEKQLEEEQKS